MSSAVELCSTTAGKELVKLVENNSTRQHNNTHSLDNTKFLRARRQCLEEETLNRHHLKSFFFQQQQQQQQQQQHLHTNIQTETSHVLQQLLDLLSTSSLIKASETDTTPTATNTEPKNKYNIHDLENIEQNTHSIQTETQSLRFATLSLSTRLYVRACVQRRRLLRCVKRLRLNEEMHIRDVKICDDYLGSKFVCMESFVKMKRLASMNRMYNLGTVPSLLRERQSMESQHESLVLRLKEIEELLMAYKDVKSHDLFHDLAKEFMVVRQQVKVTREHLEKLTVEIDSGGGGGGSSSSSSGSHVA